MKTIIQNKKLVRGIRNTSVSGFFKGKSGLNWKQFASTLINTVVVRELNKE